MTPEKRNVPLTGGATLIVSLPIKWAREIGLSEKIGITPPRECLGYRLIAKSMERIDDHSEKIARNIIELDSGVESIDRICEVGKWHTTSLRGG